jgi:hypothetical protein
VSYFASRCVGAGSSRGKGERVSIEENDDIHADWSANELSVLRSAELDAPPRGSVERTLTAIGVGTALGAGFGTSASLSSAAKLGGMARGTAWLKWLSMALVGAGIAGALFLTRHRERGASLTSNVNMPVATAVVAEPSVSPVGAGAPSAVANAPAATATAAPVVAASAPSAGSQSSARAGTADNGQDLAEEIRLIDEARGRLRRGDAAGSLETLAHYDQLAKHGGSMRAEATVVRIEALQASGDSARASALGQRFLTKNPNSPYVDYVKRILARAN